MEHIRLSDEPEYFSEKIMNYARPFHKSLWAFMKASSRFTFPLRPVSIRFLLPEIYNFLDYYSHTHYVPETDRWQLSVPMPLLHDLLGVSDDITVRNYTNHYFRDIELIVGPQTDEKRIVASTYGSFDMNEDYQLVLHNPAHIILFEIDV